MKIIKIAMAIAFIFGLNANAANYGAGVSTADSSEFEVDSRVGTYRTIGRYAEPVTVTYSGYNWDTTGSENMAVTVTVNDEETLLSSTGEGSFEWMPETSGTHILKHICNGVELWQTFEVEGPIVKISRRVNLNDIQTIYCEITSTTDDSTIYYTTDGSVPTTSSMVYTGPFVVDPVGGTIVTAMAIADGYPPSRRVMANFAPLGFELVCSSDSAEFSVDGRAGTGVSLPSDGVESLPYSGLWDGDENATVTIAQDGVAIAENLTGEGDKEWRVTEDGTYKLTHTTYTNGIAGKIETATFVVSGLSVEFPDGDVSIDGYTGKYDGLSHGITASVSDKIDGAVIKYSTIENGKFSLEKPTLTDVGTKTVWCEISAPGYITKTNSATINIAKRVVMLTSASDSKVYDGTALKAESVMVGGDGFADGEGATYTFTGSQTDVGTSDNSFTYTLNGNTKAGNYDVTTANGTLTVTAPPTAELKIDLSKTVKGKGEWGNVRLLTNSIPLKAAVAGTITSYTINVGANVDLAFVPNEGFRIYGTQAGNGPFTSTTNYTFVAMTNCTYSATFQPAPKTGFAWKYAKNKNGWFCAQIAFPGFEGYAEAFENPRFLFADRVNSQNVRTSYLVDPSTEIDPLGTTEVYGNTTYRKVALPVSALAGKVNGARVVFGVSDATMASSVDSIPAAERIMALRVVNSNINSVELLDNVVGYFAWDCCGETFYQPLGGKQSPGVILTKLLSIRTLNNASAFGIDASAVAPEYVNCSFTSFNIANGKFIGTFEVVAESDEGTKAAVQEITSSVSTLLLGSESPAGPFEAIGDEVKDIIFDVDNPPFTFQGTLPQKYKFFRLNLNIEEIYK